jgi:hypothetical protein
MWIRIRIKVMCIRTLGFKQVISVSQNFNPEFFTNGSECALFDDCQYEASVLNVELGIPTI